MAEFRKFLESNESDAKESISKLPKSHRALLRGFALRFVSGSTLPGDDKHIGKVQDKPTKSVTVAAPFYYSRLFAIYHEISHLIYAKLVKGTPLEKEWNKLCAATKNKVKDDFEEIFCHSYATAYLDHKIEKHNHPKLIDFILHRLPK